MKKLVSIMLILVMLISLSSAIYASNDIDLGQDEVFIELNGEKLNLNSAAKDYGMTVEEIVNLSIKLSNAVRDGEILSAMDKIDITKEEKQKIEVNEHFYLISELSINYDDANLSSWQTARSTRSTTLYGSNWPYLKIFTYSVNGVFNYNGSDVTAQSTSAWTEDHFITASSKVVDIDDYPAYLSDGTKYIEVKAEYELTISNPLGGSETSTHFNFVGCDINGDTW